MAGAKPFLEEMMTCALNSDLCLAISWITQHEYHKNGTKDENKAIFKSFLLLNTLDIHHSFPSAANIELICGKMRGHILFIYINQIILNSLKWINLTNTWLKFVPLVVDNQNQHFFKKWLGADLAPSHFLKQYRQRLTPGGIFSHLRLNKWKRKSYYKSVQLLWNDIIKFNQILCVFLFIYFWSG